MRSWAPLSGMNSWTSTHYSSTRPTDILKDLRKIEDSRYSLNPTITLGSVETLLFSITTII